MAQAPGTSKNNPIHMPPIVADVDVLLRTESDDIRIAWQWWQTLFKSAADTHLVSLHLDPEHDHFRLRRRGISIFEEELLRHTGTLDAAISALVEQCWGSNVPAHTRQRQYLQLDWQRSSLLIGIDSVETSRGASYQFTLLKNPGCRPTLDELGFRGKDLVRMRELLADAQGNLLLVGSDPEARTELVRAIAQALNSPDVKIVAAETPIHPHLPRINQVVYPGSDDNENHLRANWRRAVAMDADVIVAIDTLPVKDRAKLHQLAQGTRYVVNGMNGTEVRTPLLQLLADGATPQWLATTVQAIVVQHRVQLLCHHCFHPRELDDDESAWISAIQPRMSENFASWLTVNMERSYTSSPGCGECHQTGIASIKNLFEVVDLSADVRETLMAGKINASLTMMENQLGLAKRLLALAANGEISIQEAMRVTGSTRRVY